MWTKIIFLLIFTQYSIQQQNTVSSLPSCLGNQSDVPNLVGMCHGQFACNTCLDLAVISKSTDECNNNQTCIDLNLYGYCYPLFLAGMLSAFCNMLIQPVNTSVSQDPTQNISTLCSTILNAPCSDNSSSNLHNISLYVICIALLVKFYLRNKII
uniref:Transmembrane protein n=1 Tax=Acrobeloides nanus TaxID=290746 RepID=A0A914EI70_9BILA